jgi:cell division protein DivIC
MLSKIPSFFKSFYFLFAIGFFIWMLFFDTNDLINQVRMKHQLIRLEEDREYYIEKIEEVKTEREALIGNKQKLEKFARENYLMKRPSEDVYILVEE